MARTNLRDTQVKPEVSELLMLHVLRREQISPHFVRVTLGDGDIGRFRHMGFDQWFRMFIPVADDSLSRLPDKLNTLAYLKFLTIAKASRPVLRNYTVRNYRADGPEIDVDIVIHGAPGDPASGPGATWAQTCAPGDTVAILDEGIGFNAGPQPGRVLLVADESALPAVAGILASLAPETRGHAIVEVGSAEDRQDLAAPAGVEVNWVVRTDPAAVPGQAALAAAQTVPMAGELCHAWAGGEQALAGGMRRHWVQVGVPRQRIMFCGYWKASRSR